MKCKYSGKTKENNVNNSKLDKREKSNKRENFLDGKSPYMDHKFKLKKIKDKKKTNISGNE